MLGVTIKVSFHLVNFSIGMHKYRYRYRCWCGYGSGCGYGYIHMYTYTPEHLYKEYKIIVNKYKVYLY